MPAYRQVARQLTHIQEDIGLKVANGQALNKLPTISNNLVAKIIEILETGNCATLNSLQKHAPSVLVELLHVPGIEPQRVHTLYRELNYLC